MDLTKAKVFWRCWGEVIQKLVSLIASFASIVGLLIALGPPLRDFPYWAVVLLIVSAVFFLALIALEFHGHRPLRIYPVADSESIKDYMHNWIRHGGRVAIWTRDMSWAGNTQTRALLKDKAKRGELIICLPEHNELTMELAKHGAEVCTYGATRLEAPASRFTIAFYGRNGSSVAVGRTESQWQIIEEFVADGHPAFYLAEDLVALARSLREDAAA